MLTTEAIRFFHTGGPEVMSLQSVQLPELAPDEVLIEHKAIGLNFIDVYVRSGVYPSTMGPQGCGLGGEASGVVVALGAEVSGLAVGDRVAYVSPNLGAYARHSQLKASYVIKLPPELDFLTAAALMLKGLTCEYLLFRSFQLQAGQSCVIHAAAGGVGLMLVQWAKALGARTIGTVGSADKAAVATGFGLDEAVLYREQSLAERVRALTNGRGVPVVYDSVGQDTFFTSLDCLAPLGVLVSYGNASGVVPPFSLLELSKRGSLFVTRPTLFTFVHQPEVFKDMTTRLFAAFSAGHIKVPIHQQYRLDQAVLAHQDLEARRTTGCSVLVP